MPEVLKFEDNLSFFPKFNIEPFREEYIPGSVVLCMEKRDDEKVFFQIPTSTFRKMDQIQLEVVKKQIREWWQTRGDKE